MIEENIFNIASFFIGVAIFVLFVLDKKKPSDRKIRKQSEELNDNLERVRKDTREAARNLGNIEAAEEKEYKITRQAKTKAEQLREKIRTLEWYRRKLVNSSELVVGEELKERCREIIRNSEDIQDILEEPIEIAKRAYRSLWKKKHDLSRDYRNFAASQKVAEHWRMEDRREKRRMRHEEHSDIDILADLEKTIYENRRVKDELIAAKEKFDDLKGFAYRILREINYGDKHHDKVHREVRKMFKQLAKMDKIIGKIISILENSMKDEKKSIEFTQATRKDIQKEERMAA
ncbi:MAG: hypothetical protein ACMXX5_01140 [Candidatus Woesearchaeota archaeon]